MKYLEHILIIGCIIALAICCFSIPNDSKQNDNAVLVQQLIDDKIALKITISGQSKVIKSQATELENLIAEREEIFKTTLEIASENYALNKVLEDMIVSMKQMIEYIQKLENQSRDRDA